MRQNHLRRIFAILGLATYCLVNSSAHAATVVATFNSPTDVPVTANGYTATGNTVTLTLNCALPIGTELIVVKNTSLNFISGTFDNLTNGQPVTLGFGGTNYTFVANYYGGSGNDLVLVWAKNKVFAWGDNSGGQLGNGSETTGLAPTAVIATGVLGGKTIVSLAAGAKHTLALCSDGTLAAWGDNSSGQLGDGTTANHAEPLLVNTTSGVSAIYGKRVVAISAGAYFSLALCSDGTVAAWGDNSRGQLGGDTAAQRNAPVPVSREPGVSVLSNKTVVAVTSGSYHSLALCSDGSLAAWGFDIYGQLGAGSSPTGCTVVFPVTREPGTSVLYGKTVMAVAAGESHSLALCSDGTVAAWGWNADGQLGDNGAYYICGLPEAVYAGSAASALFAKTPVTVAAGFRHSMALCSDGTVAAWGWNGNGQLGDNTGTEHNVPITVATNLAFMHK